MRVIGGGLDEAVAWDKLPHCNVNAVPDAPISLALEEAAASFRRSNPGDWKTQRFAFVEGEEFRPDVALGQLLTPIFGVTPSGLVRATYSTGNVTWTELWRAVDDGVYPQSVKSAVFITDAPGAGGGSILEVLRPEYLALSAPLATFLTVYVSRPVGRAIEQVVEEKAVEALNQLRGQLAPAKVRRLAKKWAECGIDNHEPLLQYVFVRKAWPLDLFAMRLGLEKEDSERLLRVCGWVEGEVQNTWEPGPGVTLHTCFNAWLEADRVLFSAMNKEIPKQPS